MRTLLSLLLLPPGNEVWDKVMLLHLSFCSPGGGMSASGSKGGVCLWFWRGDLPLGPGHGCLPLGAWGYTPGDTPSGHTHAPWTHTHTPWTHTYSPLDTHTHPGHPPPRTLAIEAGGTHPTGLHSCCLFFFHFFNSNFLSCRSLKIS